MLDNGAQTMLEISCRLLVAIAFLVAGVSKLRRPAISAQGLQDFGVPQSLARPLGILLPVSELLVATLILLAPSARIGAQSAAALLAVFTTGIVYHLIRGNTPTCHCFGQASARPVSWRTCLRNLVLILASLCIAATPSSSNLASLAGLQSVTRSEAASALAVLLLAVVVIAEGALILQLIQQQGRLLARIEEIEVALPSGNVQSTRRAITRNARAPDFALTDAQGSMFTLETLCERDRSIAIAFLEPGCGPCRELLPRLASVSQHLKDEVLVVIASSQTWPSVPDAIADLSRLLMLVDNGGKAMKAFHVTGTPTLIIINQNRTIAEQGLSGRDQIDRYLSGLVNDRQAA